MAKIILLDSNSLINRAYYAIKYLSTKDGQMTNAIFGYLSMLNRLIDDEKPTHICAVFDERERTFRSDMYAEYKANRKGMPDELAEQLNPLKAILSAMGIRVLSKPGYEADDIIGTLAKSFEDETIIVTGDRDSLQLVDESTRVFFTKQGVTNIIKYDLKQLEIEGFTPEKIIEYKGLAGDSSDNIPGCKGVGTKTAMDLLDRFGSIDGVYENIDELKGKLKENLIESRELVALSKQLATIDSNVELDCGLEELSFEYPLPKQVEGMLLSLELKTLARRFKYSENSSSSYKKAQEYSFDDGVIAEKETPKKFFLPKRRNIRTAAEMDEYIKALPEGEKVAVVWSDELLIACGDTEAEISVIEGLFGEGLTLDEATEYLKELFSEKYVNVFFDAKSQMHRFSDFGINISYPYEDVLLKAYLINSGRKNDDLSMLVEEYGLDKAYLAASVVALDEILSERLQELELESLYRNIELPLVKCLYDMEREGFCIDSNLLEELSQHYDVLIGEYTERIFELAGETFNINSNKQLGSILFDKLKLPHGKKTKTGYSVSADVLSQIDHPIVHELIRYRQCTKLKSTYLDGMRSVMNRLTGRVHTSFKQCLTVTGRLSSTEPNLQNIPFRRAEGREIRKMFVASKGRTLVCADYSQIELRLLAHFSEDEGLIAAYKQAEDIHTATAARIHGIPLEEVTPEIRNSAKAVNFGVIYGISGFGLSNNLSVSPAKAAEYIADYFRTYPKVREYMDDNVALAKKQGYLKSMSGRIRYFPELKSSNYHMRAFAERAAMNMPLQGSASDIIKIAMLKVYNALQEGKYRSKLILQVHDELIVDCVEEEAAEVKKLVLDCMENAVELRIPLIANISEGKNWFEAK